MKRRHLCRSWFFLFLSVAVASLSSSNALELTTENFDEISIGKTVFLKFYEPE